MSKDNSSINNLLTKFLTPYMLCFACYIQVFGEIGPGGGFQAGAIFASSFIGYDLSIKNMTTIATSSSFLRLGTIGVLIYLCCGLYAIFKGKNFLNYYAIDALNPQGTGIMIVEIGVGITVASIIIFLYMELKQC